jgi:cell division protein ZapD
VLSALRGNPHVQGETLEQVLAAIEAAHQGMYQLPGKVGQHLRDDDWLMSIKQRAAIPGGMCVFDLPSFHYWLHTPAEARMEQLQRWLAPFSSIRAAVGIVLGLLRDSGQAELQHASNGSYQRMLESRNPQLIRVTLADTCRACPRFRPTNTCSISALCKRDRARCAVAPHEPIDFDLTFCNL